MRWRWDKAPLKTDDPESVMGLIMVPVTLVVVYLYHALWPGEWVRCTFREQHHLPCVSCGAYRALVALLEGKVLEAFRLQPLIVASLFLGVGYMLYALSIALFGVPKLRVEQITRRDFAALFLAAGLLTLLNWLYLVAAGI